MRTHFRRNRWSKPFRIVTMGVLSLLTIEFILGMAVNLYVKFPTSLPNGNATAWASHNSMLTNVHILLGSLIVLLAVALVVIGIMSSNKRAMLVAALGLILTLVSWISGAMFLAHGQQSILSMSMALGFLASTVVYSFGTRA